jgi:hypothetical protein
MKLGTVSAIIIACSGLLVSACGSENGSDTVTGTGTSRADRNRAVLETLPVCPEATAVREFSLTNYDGPDVLARDYALAVVPDDCLRSLFEGLTASGWQEDAAGFTKDGDRVRVDIAGSELSPLDSAYTVSQLADPPASTLVYFTIGVTADFRTSSPTGE